MPRLSLKNKKMMIYKITKSADEWIAQRDSQLRGKTKMTLARFSNLKAAQKRLLEFYNDDYPCETNWGMAVCHNPYCAWSCKDGTRGYEYDGRNYCIEEVDISLLLWDYYAGGNVMAYDITSEMGIILNEEKAVDLIGEMNRDMRAANSTDERDAIVSETERKLAKLM